MYSIINGILHVVVGLPRRKRRALLAAIDLMALMLTVWALHSIRYWTFFVPDRASAAVLMVLGPLLTVGVFLGFRVYHMVARYLGLYGSLRLGLCVAIATAIWSAILLNVGQFGVPRSVLLAYVPVGTAVVVLIRLSAAQLLSFVGIELRRSRPRSPTPMPVLIWGTGPHAVQLGRVTQRNRTRKLVGYIDKTGIMAGRYIGRHKIYRSNKISFLISEYGVEEIYLAEPHQGPKERQELLRELERFNIRVRLLPDLEALALGRVGLNQLRGVRGRDLLGRQEVPLDPVLVAKSIKGKCVLVTGAGGTIGSQLALSVFQFEPRRIILFEQSELAIYSVERACMSVLSTLSEPPELIKALGSVGDAVLVNEVLRANGVDVVFHAAAYKHVPIVEEHPLAGISNNVVATELLARACQNLGVERFVLISTDKAVRPTNVMGATKRVAELIVRALAEEPSNTIFTTVRFGNVLESSGSVFGLFESQIRGGGPVTVTDPNVVRYFMSIHEASNLVLQAAAMAKGGETFVLDMGEPIKIDVLARSMIRLMGYEERTKDNPDGEIEIRYIGLRPGEKLIEELVLSDHNISGTQHPRIWRAQEPSVDLVALKSELDTLKSSVHLRSVPLALTALENLVEGYVAWPLKRSETQPMTDKITLH